MHIFNLPSKNMYKTRYFIEIDDWILGYRGTYYIMFHLTILVFNILYLLSQTKKFSIIVSMSFKIILRCFFYDNYKKPNLTFLF